MTGPPKETEAAAPGAVIVATKLHIPAPRAGLIERNELVTRLVDGARTRLTLLNAPPGSGKTTLLAAWHATSGAQRPFAWVSLDEGDNDAVRFWQYVIEALRTVDPAAGEAARTALDTRGMSLTDLVVPMLLNDLATRGTAQVLVLDDYHVITNSVVHDSLAYLLDHLPETLHIAIATRSDPPLPIGRLRARGELTEVRAADLRFTSDEAAAFLNVTLGLDLQLSDVARLQQRTEGWAAGLYLAALSLRGRPDQSRFIESFAGDDRQIVDYLLSEVLAGQPDEVRGFLLETSILDRLSGPLCDAVTGWAHGAAMLERIERSNLFLIPLDTRRTWYRYHNLFGQLLQHELGRVEPEIVPELHRRAYRWHLDADSIPEAVRHAAAAGDTVETTALVAAHWNAYFNQGRLGTVAGWLSALGEEVVRADARICVAAAWLALDDGRLDEAETWIARAEALIAGRSETAREVESDTAVLRAVHSFKTGDLDKARRAGLRVLEVEGDRESFARTVGHHMDGITLYWGGHPREAVSALEQAERLARATGNDLGAAYAIGYRAAISADTGDPERAEVLADAALGLSDDPGFSEHFVAMMGHLGRGRARLRRGEASEAVHDLVRALELSRRGAGVIERAAALVELARANAMLGNDEESRRLAAEARDALEGCADPGTIASAAELGAQDMPRRTTRERRESAAEDLTDRELDVLRLLGSELSQREIGEALYVSLNTVKSHTRGIFRKLDASSRDEAVERAHDLGLI
jgi:LuxR family maltose regulon positive regulatory protein